MSRKHTSGKFPVNRLPLVKGYLIPRGIGELLVIYVVRDLPPKEVKERPVRNVSAELLK
jgi:hypothetical protein